MASLEDVVYDELAGTEGVTDLVSTSIYRGWRPQGTSPPCISFFRVDTLPIKHAGGNSTTINTRLQIDCWATTQNSARAIADAVYAVMNGWTNDSSPAVGPAVLLTDQDLVEPAEEGEGHAEYRVTQDYSLWWTVA